MELHCYFVVDMFLETENIDYGNGVHIFHFASLEMESQ